MNLRQLEIFRAVMLTGTTVDAAGVLLISQPAVSNAILHLEDQLGFNLFERVKGRLHPTEEAKLLFTKSENVFTNFNMVRDLVQDLKDRQAGSLRIVASPSIGQTMIPTQITALRRDSPRVKVYFEIRRYDAIVDLIATQQRDLAFTLRPSEHPSVESSVLATGSMVCVLPKDHPLASQEFLDPSGLADLPLISFSRDTPMGLVVDNAFRKAGLHREVAIEVDHCYTACILVECDAGVAIVDEFTARSGRYPGLAVLPFRPKSQISVSVLRNRNMPMSLLAESFLANYINAGDRQ